MKISFVILSTLIISTLAAQPSIKMHIQSLPEFHPAGSDIYLAGSFNGWNPADTTYRFAKDKTGNYVLQLRLAPGTYEYKFTRGSWDKAECKKGGETAGNRTLVQTETGTNVSAAIEEWADRFPSQPRISTASPNVKLLDTAFLIPQLKRTRRIWIYTPADYAHSTERYPVLYMHDGQNLFDDATSYSGEWGIDEFMDSTKLPKMIIVGIDHGGEKRLNEYNPFNSKKFGKGEGKMYATFLAKTLKPYIDREYRTRPGSETTFIAGSSMGGLISFYTALQYPNIFGAAGVFSPAFWITNGAMEKEAAKTKVPDNLRFYFYGGAKEGETMVPDMKRIAQLVQEKSKAAVRTIVKEDGRHNEGNWRREFPAFYKWLLGIQVTELH